jgi:hypothetical protein
MKYDSRDVTHSKDLTQYPQQPAELTPSVLRRQDAIGVSVGESVFGCTPIDESSTKTTIPKLKLTKTEVINDDYSDTDLNHKPQNFAPTIVMVLDASGSMFSIAESTISSVNRIIDDQKAGPVDDAKMSMFLFADTVRTLFAKKPIREVKPITRADYYPDGWTALNDAIGVAITTHDEEKDVLMIIVTDGLENKSRIFTDSRQITDMINKKKSIGWKFIYISNQLDVAAQGSSLGITPAAVGCVRTSSDNVVVGSDAYAEVLSTHVNANIQMYRTTSDMAPMDVRRRHHTSSQMSRPQIPGPPQMTRPITTTGVQSTHGFGQPVDPKIGQAAPLYSAPVYQSQRPPYELVQSYPPQDPYNRYGNAGY